MHGMDDYWHTVIYQKGEGLLPGNTYIILPIPTLYSQAGRHSLVCACVQKCTVCAYTFLFTLLSIRGAT